jgi:DNA polymerase-4
VTLKIRYAPFRTLTRRCTLPEGTWATADLLAAALRLFEERTERGAAPVRLLGVSTSGFSAQETLFPAPQAKVDEAVDRVREKFGTAAVRRGSVLESGHG